MNFDASATSQTMVTIGDARKAGKSKEAIASAFSAALLEHHS